MRELLARQIIFLIVARGTGPRDVNYLKQEQDFQDLQDLQD